MKNIRDEKYASMLKLIQSGVKEDNIIGVSLLIKEFSPEEIYSSFKPALKKTWNKSTPYWFDVGGLVVLDFVGVEIEAYSLENNETDYLFLTENKQSEKIEL